MAYGTKTIRAVDKIVGPGNIYVSLAKRLVYGQVGIDFIAGPSEVMIIADKTANPSFIAADLIAQAEHDVEALAILITPSLTLAEAVKRELENQLDQLLTMDIAKKSLEKNGCIILVDSIEEAIQIANKKAPEHVELHVENPDKYQHGFKNFGTLFIGECAAEVLGDYSSGLNHILPTNRAARYAGGLGVKDFFKVQTILKVTPEGIKRIGPQAQLIAELEGLAGHANSVKIRMKNGEKRGTAETAEITEKNILY
jgi:histidinol dehydrogenase